MNDQILRVTRDDGVVFALGCESPVPPEVPGQSGRYVVNFIFDTEAYKSTVRDEDGDEQVTEYPAMCRVALTLLQHVEAIKAGKEVPPSALAAIVDFPTHRVVECIRGVKLDELTAMIAELIAPDATEPEPAPAPEPALGQTSLGSA